MASKDEQETTVTWIAADNSVQIYSAVPKHLRRLRADKRVTEVKGNAEYGVFTVSARNFDPLGGFKRTRKEMTPAQKAVAVERLAAARAKKES